MEKRMITTDVTEEDFPLEGTLVHRRWMNTSDRKRQKTH